MIIGLHGLPRCGKDTIAGLLIQQHDFARYAFAGPLKDMLIAGLGLQRHELNAEDKEAAHPRLGCSVRYLLQTLGTEWGRNLVRGDLWIQIADERTIHFRKAQIPLVFTDVRFENEAAFVRRLGGALWHIRRPSNNVHNLHESNRGLPIERGVDSVLHNDQGVEQLGEQVRLALAGCLIVPLEAA